MQPFRVAAGSTMADAPDNSERRGPPPEQPGPVPQGDVPEAVADARRSRWAPLIWVIPVIALGVAAWLALQGVLNIGTAIEITFNSGEGLEAGRTRIKYRDIDIGIVKAIELTDGPNILVKAEINSKAKHLVVEDTRFWVVRPRITGGQALGLGTILTGSHIAMDPGKSGSSRRSFTGLEQPPAITTDAPGRLFTLRAANLGSVDVGSPVYFRRVRVGKTVSTELDKEGKGVVIQVFVNAPYDRFVTAGTRFWDVSGVAIALDSGGFRVETESLTAIVIGGIAFETPPQTRVTAPAAPDTAFTLFSNRDSAMKEIYTIKDSYILYFTHSVRGLSVGAPVNFLGVEIGEVTSIDLDFNREQGSVRPAVGIVIYPERLSARMRERGPTDEPGRRVEALQRWVDRGLRAQLSTGNLLTGQAYVALNFFPKEPRVKINAGQTPPEIPTVPGGFEELQNTVTNVAKNLEKVPFAEVAADFRKAATELEATLKEMSALSAQIRTDIAPEVRATLGDARATLEKAQILLAEDAPLQGDLQTTLREVRRAAQAVRGLADSLERHPESLLRGRKDDTQ
jgi:paraquat-inducible protein B